MADLGLIRDASFTLQKSKYVINKYMRWFCSLPNWVCLWKENKSKDCPSQNLFFPTLFKFSKFFLKSLNYSAASEHPRRSIHHREIEDHHDKWSSFQDLLIWKSTTSWLAPLSSSFHDLWSWLIIYNNYKIHTTCQL